MNTARFEHAESKIQNLLMVPYHLNNSDTKAIHPFPYYLEHKTWINDWLHFSKLPLYTYIILVPPIQPPHMKFIFILNFPQNHHIFRVSSQKKKKKIHIYMKINIQTSKHKMLEYKYTYICMWYYIHTYNMHKHT